VSQPFSDIARRLPRGTAILLLAGSFLAGGCGEPAPDGPGHVRVDTLPDGVAQVANDLPARPHALLDWQLVPEATFATPAADADGGPDATPLSHVADVATDAAGRVYVLDGLAQTVFVFAADGSLERRIGGQGEGPGELLGAIGLDVDERGYLWVVDPRLRRYTVFGPDGGRVAPHVRPVQGSSPPWEGEVTEGAVLDWGLAFPDEGPDVIAGERVRFEPLRVRAASGRVDSLPPITFRQEMVADGSRPNPFFSGSLALAVDAAAGTVWFADTRRYELSARTLAGEKTLVATLDVAPAPVTSADVDDLRSRFQGRPGALAPYLESLPRSWPVIESVDLDPGGYAYVLPRLDDVAPGTAVDVFDRTGAYLGRLPLPRPVETGPGLHLDGDHLYVVVTDALDVPRVQRLRIERSRR